MTRLFGAGGSATHAGAERRHIRHDVNTAEQVAKAARPYPNFAGVLATPGLVWSGEIDGTLAAFDSKTLEEKWSINMGTTCAAPRSPSALNGKQCIAIAGGAST